MIHFQAVQNSIRVMVKENVKDMPEEKFVTIDTEKGATSIQISDKIFEEGSKKFGETLIRIVGLLEETNTVGKFVNK